MRLGAGQSLALVLALGGCTTTTDDAAMTSASVAATTNGARQIWQGVITGRELATAAGPATMKALLTLNPDGTFTMVCDNGRATGRAIRQGDTLVLEGALENGRPVRYRLQMARPDHAAGSAHTYFAGHSVEAGINLQRVN